ncbi:hypothetical protein SpT5_067 [Staphylococcus phage SpT5]|uniref:Uncharacterized protein n=2 Tax=Coventryvirus TaxID=2843370 RepID=A0A1J0MF63_9CAUD|nr:hypothetical protein SpT5_067 [Staphylococcus phage SpT5]APD19949.1 hypothetical protein SpT252_066 [Staphylococcus phage SpT252]
MLFNPFATNSKSGVNCVSILTNPSAKRPAALNKLEKTLTPDVFIDSKAFLAVLDDVTHFSKLCALEFTASETPFKNGVKFFKVVCTPFKADDKAPKIESAFNLMIFCHSLVTPSRLRLYA